MSFKDSKFSTVLLIVVMGAAFMMLAGGIALYHLTLTKWWIPVIPGAVAAIATLPAFYNKWDVLTGVSSNWVNMLCHVFVAGSVGYFLFLGVNFWCADAGTDVAEKAEVVEKFQKSHTRYRRVSRRTRVADGHYYTYHLMLRLEDGEEKEVSVPLKTYNRTRTGSMREIHVQKGALGMRVIKLGVGS
ncbi:MAG: hypothetical protein K2M04_06185 [Muribaculaceae bacterium]|nr:hypothetical protein [Muribaculaceae bacterium]